MDSVALVITALEEAELEKREINRCLRNERKFLRNSYNPLMLDDILFKKNFRLNKSSFQYVLKQLESEISSIHKSYALTPKQKLCTLLRFLAEGCYQHGVGKGYEVAMSQTSISRVLAETLDALEKRLCPIWIKIQMTDEEKIAAKLDFFERTGFPGVIMCVDSTHIKIFPPTDKKHLYLNRKGFFSLNAMIICDNTMQIRSVNSCFPGCNRDSHVWSLSDARSFFEEQFQQGERNSWLLGDSGYALEPWLLTPFPSPAATSPESIFNKKHNQARNIVEQTIGVLKNRFRCLFGARQLHYSPRKVVQIVNVCCALHNICLHYQMDHAEYLPQNNAEITDKNDGDEESNVVTDLFIRNEAVAIRNNVMNLLQ